MNKSRRKIDWVVSVLVFLWGSVAIAGAKDGLDLDPLMGTEKVWALSQDDFAKKYVKKDEFASFEWVSSAKDSARLRHLRHWVLRISDKGEKRLTPTIGKGEHEVGEVIVRFKDKTVSRVEMSIYNRGDDGEIPKTEFLEKLRRITSFVDAKLEGVKREPRPASGRGTTSGLLWRGKEDFYLLEYSYQKEEKGRRFRPEFVILKVAPRPKGGGLVASKPKMKTRSDLSREVVREDNGDILIKTVPMVDQGQKGYCAVASAERVMRYYGVDVNQHEMAQISNTTQWGTSGEEMTKALTAAAGKYHTRVLTLFEFSYADEKGWKKMEKVAKSYNRLAKKEGKKEFDTDKYWIPIGQLLSQGDPKLLKEVRASGTKYDRFKSAVYRYVDDGVPVLWALYLGVFKEEGLPQSGGGHMRLIIGYNKKDDTVLYSDSWGAGHELKRMRMDEAYTMTMGLMVLQPAH